MKLSVLLLAFLLSLSASGREVFRIEIGKENRQYSQSELQRRVWELERAVWQLQQQVFHLENTSTKNEADTVLCTVKARGNTFTGTGPNQAVAKAKAMEACRAGNKGDSFFCGDPHCE